MILLNECRITADNKFLIVDASVDPRDCFDDVNIQAVVIDTQKTFVDNNGPSNKYIYKKEFTNESSVYSDGCNVYSEDSKIITDYNTNGKKYIRMYIPFGDSEGINANPNEDMFFVYILSSSPSSPSNEDNNRDIIMGVAVNFGMIYNKSMHFIKELNKGCEIPKNFIDIILRLRALELSLATGNYQTAIKQWECILASIRHPIKP